MYSQQYFSKHTNCACMHCCQAPLDVETPDFGALSWESTSYAGSSDAERKRVGASEAEKKRVAAAKGWKGVGEWQASRQPAPSDRRADACQHGLRSM